MSVVLALPAAPPAPTCTVRLVLAPAPAPGPLPQSPATGRVTGPRPSIRLRLCPCCLPASQRAGQVQVSASRKLVQNKPPLSRSESPPPLCLSLLFHLSPSCRLLQLLILPLSSHTAKLSLYPPSLIAFFPFLLPLSLSRPEASLEAFASTRSPRLPPFCRLAHRPSPTPLVSLICALPSLQVRSGSASPDLSAGRRKPGKRAAIHKPPSPSATPTAPGTLRQQAHSSAPPNASLRSNSVP
ncbi:hypothetical protein J3F83DRAFT_398911 [Trichoderma novae-zelandiae]